MRRPGRLNSSNSGRNFLLPFFTAQAARDAALSRSPSPGSPAVLVHQSAHADTERQLDAPGLIDVPADAIKLGAIAAGVAGVLRVGWNAHRLEPFRAPAHDVSHAS